MKFQWASHEDLITLHTIHVVALENCTKINNIKKNIIRTLIGNRRHEKNKFTCHFY